MPCGQAAGNGDHTNVFLWTGTETDATIELTHNWDGEDEAKMDPQGDRKIGHIAIGVAAIYGICATNTISRGNYPEPRAFNFVRFGMRSANKQTTGQKAEQQQKYKILSHYTVFPFYF